MSRVKKQKVCHSPTDYEADRKKRKNLLDLPNEVLLMILRSITCDDLARIVRIVGKKLHALCSDVLKRDFYKLNEQLQMDIEKHHSLLVPGRCSGILRSYHFSLSLLSEHNLTMATIWRYVYWKCTITMFAGSIIDSLRTYLNTPMHLREKHLVDGIRHYCKLYQDFFEDYIERPRNKSPNFSGARLVDILDCMIIGSSENHASKEIIQNFQDSEGFYMYDCVYCIPYSWYTCLDQNKDICFRGKFRNMCHFVRRIISKHNYQAARNTTFAISETVKDNMFDTSIMRFWFRAMHYGSTTFYGVMNRTFHDRTMEIEGGTVSEEVPKLCIRVTLRCSMSLAPKNAIEAYLSNSLSRQMDSSELYIGSKSATFDDTISTAACDGKDSVISKTDGSGSSYFHSSPGSSNSSIESGPCCCLFLKDEESLEDTRSEEFRLSSSSNERSSTSSSSENSSDSSVLSSSSTWTSERDSVTSTDSGTSLFRLDEVKTRRFSSCSSKCPCQGTKPDSDEDFPEIFQVLPTSHSKKEINDIINKSQNSLFKMSVKVSCPLSKHGRLPHFFTWNVN